MLCNIFGCFYRGKIKKITYLTINNLSYLKIQYHEKLYKSITLFFIVQVSG